MILADSRGVANEALGRVKAEDQKSKTNIMNTWDSDATEHRIRGKRGDLKNID